MSITQSIKNGLARVVVRRSRTHDTAIEILEQKHVDLTLPWPNDSSFFYGGDRQGNAFICRMAFRGPKRDPEYWFDFYITDMGYVGLGVDPGPEGSGFQLGRLQWEPLIIGKEWIISYEGPLHDDAESVYDAKVELVFRGNHEPYDFADSSDRKAIAEAIALEPWNARYFNKLKELSQVHYEQTGTLTGYLELNGKRKEFSFTALRDHSYGSRNWLQWDRHYWMSGVCENGTVFTVTTIRYDFIGRLSAGFIADGKGNLDAIINCTGLDEISKKKLWPEKGIVAITTRGGKSHTLEFSREGHFPYLMDEAYQMLEGIGRYSFDGNPALGMIEFGFHRDKYDINEER